MYVCIVYILAWEVFKLTIHTPSIGNILLCYILLLLVLGINYSILLHSIYVYY